MEGVLKGVLLGRVYTGTVIEGCINGKCLKGLVQQGSISLPLPYPRLPARVGLRT